MSRDPEMSESFTTEITEWAIQCLTRDGDTFTGTVFSQREQAEDSGVRLERINGADWWLISRRRAVTVKTWPWEPAPHAAPTSPDSDEEQAHE